MFYWHFSYTSLWIFYCVCLLRLIYDGYVGKDLEFVGFLVMMEISGHSAAISLLMQIGYITLFLWWKTLSLSLWFVCLLSVLCLVAFVLSICERACVPAIWSLSVITLLGIECWFLSSFYFFTFSLYITQFTRGRMFRRLKSWLECPGGNWFFCFCSGHLGWTEEAGKGGSVLAWLLHFTNFSFLFCDFCGGWRGLGGEIADR